MQIREYRETDYQELLEICKTVWEGRDYLPKIIHDLAKDEFSYPMVVLDGGKLVSIANLRVLNSQIVWLEAIRTHPESRGKGYATSLTISMLSKAQSLGAKQAWLLLNQENLESLKIAEKLGFQILTEISMWPSHELMQTSLEAFLSQSNQKEFQYNQFYSDYIETMDFSTTSYDLFRNWRKCQSISILEEVLNKLRMDNMDYLIGEFELLPKGAYKIETLFHLGQIYYLREPPALLTVQKSKEKENITAFGLITNSLSVLESTLLFIRETWPKEIYWLFFPAALQHFQIQPGFHHHFVLQKSLFP